MDSVKNMGMVTGEINTNEKTKYEIVGQRISKLSFSLYKVITTDGINVARIIDCWISADETTGKRLLRKSQGEKLATNVRNLFFELHFWSFSQIGMGKRQNTQEKNKNRDQRTKNMLIAPSNSLV